MAKKKGQEKPGFGKLLEAWTAPDDAGESIGCLATSFTFSPAFFEEECLARFLQLESDPTEDGPVYLVEREEKLAQLTCAAALVDQHHCRGSRSLRWDLIPARLPKGLQHAKISLLYWSRLVRLIIASANLTEDGYRRNLEVYGVVDFHMDSEAPVSCLQEALAFLRLLGAFGNTDEGVSPPLQRWNALLDRVESDCSAWGVADQASKRRGVHVRPLFSGPGLPSVFDGLRECWPGGTPPDTAFVVSPFFDPPAAENTPAKGLWSLLRQRGAATVNFFVTVEEIPGEEGLFLNAPESLLRSQPQGRPSINTQFHRVVLSGGRSLHAKGIWIADTRWSVYQIGSSNFTSAGLGLSNNPNFEANLVYLVDVHRFPEARRTLDATFPEGELIDPATDIRWKSRPAEGEDEVGQEVLLPLCFGEATFDVDTSQQATIQLLISGMPPTDWQLITDGDSVRFWGEQEWADLGRPEQCSIPWKHDRPPSGFWVHWPASPGPAWWPVNVSAGDVLPPPEELKHLPLDVLINILSSARPLHRVLQEYLKRRQKQVTNGENCVIVDPHKRVDTSQFLLQRTRRISWALIALRKRLECPVVTLEFLRWRLRGPVGVMALAQALIRESRSEAEKAFLLSELALELARANPEAQAGCLAPEIHRAEIRQIIEELHRLMPLPSLATPENLNAYVALVFKSVLP